MFQCPKGKNLAFRELGSEQTPQFLRASLAVDMYALRDGRNRELFLHVFCERNLHGTQFNGRRVLQLVPEVSQANAHIRYTVSLPIAFETQLYFHAMDLMSREARRKSRISSEAW